MFIPILAGKKLIHIYHLSPFQDCDHLAIDRHTMPLVGGIVGFPVRQKAIYV